MPCHQVPNLEAMVNANVLVVVVVVARTVALLSLRAWNAMFASK
jgi:hypothetical protein